MIIWTESEWKKKIELKKDENDKRIDLNGEDELVSGTRIMSIVDG